MFISKVKLTWSQARNPYEQHRALWKLFPDRCDEQRDFLFRVEQVVKGQGAKVLMQSLSRPVENDVTELVAVRSLNLPLQKGQLLRFRLRANPVKTIKDGHKGEKVRNGKVFTKTTRVPLIREEEQLAWLSRKLEGAAGFQAITVQSEMPLNFRKQSEKRSGKIQSVLFDGILVVENPDELNDRIKTGIGPAKSFGCGLLSLAAQ